MIDPFTFLVGQGMETGGSLISTAANLWNQDRMADRAERLANTAHQREVADLRKAGLNPILSAKGGGASVPVMSPTRIENPFSGAAANAVNSARMQNENALVEDQRRKLQADTKVSEKQLEVMDSQIQAQSIQNMLTRHSATLAGLKVPESEAWADVAKLILTEMRKTGFGDGATFRSVLDKTMERLGVPQEARDAVRDFFEGRKAPPPAGPPTGLGVESAEDRFQRYASDPGLLKSHRSPAPAPGSQIKVHDVRTGKPVVRGYSPGVDRRYERGGGVESGGRSSARR